MRCIASTLIAVLLLGSLAWAHVGFDHFVGEITAIDDKKVEVKTEKATVTFKLTAETRYLRRGHAVARKDFAVGSRVVVDARREKGAWFAKEVRFVVEPER
jgi:hypothetical protein